MKRQMRLAAPGNLQKITGRNPGGARKLLMGGSVPGGGGGVAVLLQNLESCVKPWCLT